MNSSKTFREAESIYDRATKLELAAEFKSASRLYLEAGDAFLNLSRSHVATPAFQAQCKESALKAIQRAEKIKNASKAPGSQIGLITAPINPFAADHQAYVLQRSSIVNGTCYSLWNESVSLPQSPGTRYSDPDGQPAIPLSKTASSTITWQRSPRDPFTSQGQLTLTPADIEQNIIEDCSVCAAVAICVQHNQRFNSKLLSSPLYSGNQSGRYDLKGYLNGDFRRVCGRFSSQPIGAVTIFSNPSSNHIDIVIVVKFTCLTTFPELTLEAVDDLLPYDDTGRPIGISSGKTGVAWPALIEKAYMKIMGGYDFPGSNSSIDLRVLTGWIPEHINLQSTTFERERTWKRIADGFQRGFCVLTVGTDAKTTLKIAGVKLLPSHDYAVVDVQERKDDRWLTLIDSRISPADSSPRTESKSNSTVSDSRMLDMRWDDICASFEGIYASWNPALLPNSVDFHGTWKSDDEVQGSMRSLRLLYECQNVPGEGGDPLDTRRDIWVLLTKHFSQTRREAEYISLTVHPTDEDDWTDGRTKLGGAEVKGSYTTSPHMLVKITARKEHSALPKSSTLTKISGVLSVLASYDGPFDEVFFTLNVFCGADVKAWWDETAGIGNSISPGGCEFSTKVTATLTTKNAGGNHTHPTYMLNPQWHLRIHDDHAGSSGRGLPTTEGRASPLRGHTRRRAGQKSVVMLSAQGPREVPLNMTAVWSSGERIVELAQKEVVTSSGPYTYGRARSMANMAPGDYTVILSAFEPQHLGKITVKLESSHRFDFKAIPQEGAGMYTRISKGEWGEHTAVGGPTRERYHANPVYEVQLSCSAQLGARLHLTSPMPTAALNLSMFRASALDRPVGSSGPYSDALAGVYIPPRLLSQGRYWLIPSTFTAGIHASFRLVVYSSDSRCTISRLP